MRATWDIPEPTVPQNFAWVCLKCEGRFVAPHTAIGWVCPNCGSQITEPESDE